MVFRTRLTGTYPSVTGWLSPDKRRRPVPGLAANQTVQGGRSHQAGSRQLMRFEKEFSRDMGSMKEVKEVPVAAPPVPEGGDLAKRHEGQLSKFTNVVKGWQYRWFVLDPETGLLDYFLPEERGGRSRGRQHLAGAVVVPSQEDGHTFSINFSSGEVYKVRASQVRERQVWVDRLRACSHRHSLARAGARGGSREQTTTTPPGLRVQGEQADQLQSLPLSTLDAFGSVHDMLRKVEEKHRHLSETIEALPPGKVREEGEAVPDTVTPHCHDPKLLLLKATSQSTMVAMEEALAMLQQLREDQLSATVSSLSVPSLQFTQSVPASPTKTFS